MDTKQNTISSSYLIIYPLLFLVPMMWLLPSNTGVAKMIIDPDTSKGISSPLGTVTLVKGKAQKIRIGEEEKIKVKKGGKIAKGDIIQTGRASIVRAKMTNADQSVVTLGPVSSFEFKDSIKGPNKIKTSVYRFLSGQVRARFAQSSHENKTKINLGKNVSMGIRGTELLANYRPDLKDYEISQIALLEGLLDVTSGKDSKVHQMRPGDYLIYVEDKQTGAVGRKIAKIDPQMLEKLKDFENTPFLDYFKGNLDEILQSGDGSAAAAGGRGQTGAGGKSMYGVPTREGRKTKSNSWRKLLKELNKKYGKE